MSQQQNVTGFPSLTQVGCSHDVKCMAVTSTEEPVHMQQAAAMAVVHFSNSCSQQQLG